MTLAYVTAAERGQTDRVLRAVADRLGARGIALAGVVQTNSRCRDGGHCDMDVEVLGDGAVIRISQDLGPGASGCRLNPEALEHAVARVEAVLKGPTRLLIVNKFGKHEAEGRGFRNLIGEALSSGLPVLTAVNAENRAAFAEFHGGLAQELAADAEAVLDWFEGAVTLKA
ncbi:MAG: DUF2478 domain-containing protein [Paracoccaceae bacterium]